MIIQIINKQQIHKIYNLFAGGHICPFFVYTFLGGKCEKNTVFIDFIFTF